MLRLFIGVAALGIALVAIVATRSRIAGHQPAAPIVSTTERPAGSWRFQPQADMTPAEAAASVALMMMGPDFIPAVGERVEAMPPELRRHWLAPVTNGQEQAK